MDHAVALNGTSMSFYTIFMISFLFPEKNKTKTTKNSVRINWQLKYLLRY